MQRQQFVKCCSTFIGSLPFSKILDFLADDTTFIMDAELMHLTIGEFRCTVLRDLLFKYLAKDFFINAKEEEINAALKKFNAAPENIPSPFIALLLQYGD